MNNKIIYLQYTNPAGYPPLEHSSRILADRGWKVTFVGCGASGEADLFEFPPHDNIRVLRWKFHKPGWHQKFHFFLWTWWAFFVTFWNGACWVYSSDILSCPAAWLVSFIPGRKVIYHEHDSPSVKNLSNLMKSLLRYRKSVCHRANVAVLPNAQRAKLFLQNVQPKCPVQIVWNVPEIREVVDVPYSASEKFVLFYHGSLNFDRLPLSILDAMILMPPKTALHFAGYTTNGSNTFIVDYLKEAKKRGLGERVQYIGSPKLRSELLSVASRANLGLAFMPIQSPDINMVAMAGASNKPFDYLACGLNLLVSDLPEWNEMFVNPGLGFGCDPRDPKSLAFIVRNLIDNPELAKSMRQKGYEKIKEEWNYETQFKTILTLMEL